MTESPECTYHPGVVWCYWIWWLSVLDGIHLCNRFPDPAWNHSRWHCTALMLALCNHKQGFCLKKHAVAFKYTLSALTTSKECRAITLRWTGVGYTYGSTMSWLCSRYSRYFKWQAPLSAKSRVLDAGWISLWKTNTVACGTNLAVQITCLL